MSIKGKILISTRPCLENDELKDLLLSKEAKYYHSPMIEITKSDFSNHHENILNNINQYDWIVFTSSNGVKYFDELLKKNSEFSTFSSKIKFACYGSKTSDEATKTGYKPSIQSVGLNSTELITDIRLKVEPGSKILLVLGDKAPDILEKQMKSDYLIDRIDVYRTFETNQLSQESIELIKSDLYDLILFTSASGVRSFFSASRNIEKISEYRMACLGSSTKQEIENHGYKPVLVSSFPDCQTFVNELENYFLNK